MQVTIEIPDELASRLPSRSEIPRELLEAYAAEAYRAERLSRKEVGTLLHLDRWQTEEFIARRGAIRPFTADDFALEQSGK